MTLSVISATMNSYLSIFAKIPGNFTVDNYIVVVRCCQKRGAGDLCQ